MYLCIFEDGESWAREELQEEDFQAWNEGILAIYRFSDSKIEEYDGNNRWLKVNKG